MAKTGVGGIVNLELNAVATVPIIRLQTARHMDQSPALQKGLTDLCIPGPPGHRPQFSAALVGQGAAHMSALERGGLIDPQARSGKDRLWIAGAEGGQALEVIIEGAPRPARRDQSVNIEQISRLGLFTLVGQFLFEEGAKLGD